MKFSYDQPFTFDRVIRLVIATLGFFFVIFMIYSLSSVLLPFLIAWLIAYILNPFVRFLQTKIKIRSRVLAVITTFILVLSLLTGIVMLIAPIIETEIEQINTLILSYKPQSLKVEWLPLDVSDFFENHVDFQVFRDALNKENAQDVFNYLAPKLQGLLSSSISFLLGFTVIFIVILYLIFILIDYEKINKMWINFIPPKYRVTTQKLATNVENSMNTYFRNQALICVIVGTLFAIAFQIVGLPLAILMGVIIAVLHMIPYMHTLSILPVTMLCWLRAAETGQSFWGLLGIVLLIYAGMQFLIDVILVPKIMGKAMGLNPAIILLSLSIWGYLLGIVGMIIAIPLTTLLISYYQEFIASMPDPNLEKETEKVGETEN